MLRYVWFELAQVLSLLSQLLWAHLCNCPVISGKHCFLAVNFCSWRSESFFLLSSTMIPEPWEEWGMMSMSHLGMRNPSTRFYSCLRFLASRSMSSWHWHKNCYCKQWVSNLRRVLWWMSDLTLKSICFCSLGNNTGTPGMSENPKTRKCQFPKIAFTSPAVVNKRGGAGKWFVNIQNAQMGIPKYSIWLFYFCDKTLWWKATWGEKGLFQLTLLGHGSSLREVGPGCQGGTESEATEECSSLTDWHSASFPVLPRLTSQGWWYSCVLGLPLSIKTNSPRQRQPQANLM